MALSGRALLPKVSDFVVEVCASLVNIAELSEDVKGIKKEPAPPEAPSSRPSTGIGTAYYKLQSFFSESQPLWAFWPSPAAAPLALNSNNPELSI